MRSFISFIIVFFFLISCDEELKDTPPPYTPVSFELKEVAINGSNNEQNYYNIDYDSEIKLIFSAPVRSTSVTDNIYIKNDSGQAISYNLTYDNDSTLVLQPAAALAPITKYTLYVAAGLLSQNNQALKETGRVEFVTAIDSTDKFPRISDSALLTLVEHQTFKYFWDFAHPVSGMARERNTSGDIVTTGGTGFGIMAILVGIHRNFISRTAGLSRIQKIVSFLENKVTRYHGAFPHWINGATGETIPFSRNDNGADLVETSFLIQGLLCARQFFDHNNQIENTLRKNINELWNGVEWNWFRQGGRSVLYWHWSPDKEWIKSLEITGWNEALIVYVLAASSNTHSISKAVYDNCWARNGVMQNGKQFFEITLPLGTDYGGPLFFAHYSFLGLNPQGLSDKYADYWTQNTAHTMINYLYCTNNPKGFNGYSGQCWGLTASDDNNGYKAHSPTNDDGVISPTAAVSSIPYTPENAIKALKFFYYKLGDKVWGKYGFKDAFNLTEVWFADTYLAIDQGPQIVMIENYRSGILWDLFMSCPEIKRGLKRLEFTW